MNPPPALDLELYQAPPSSSVSHNHGGSRSSRSRGGDAEEWRPWADIAYMPLLDMLPPRLTPLDRARLFYVCRPWRDSLANHPSFRRLLFPWLLMQSNTEFKRGLFFLCESGDSTIDLSHTYDTSCLAASHGWLITFGRSYMPTTQGYEVLLINPLSGGCINLPALPVSNCRAALSAAPTEPGCAAMCLARVAPRHWDMYCCSIGDKAWHRRGERFLLKSNIAGMGGKFYFLCKEGLAEIDLSGLKWLKLTGEIFNIPDESHWLVESDGELLLVTLLVIGLDDRYSHQCEKRGRVRYACVLHRADFARKTWVRVENLRQGESLFLSPGSCVSVIAEEDGEDVGGSGRVHVSRRVRRCILSSWEELQEYRYAVLQGPLDHCSPSYTEAPNYSNAIWFMPSL